MAEQSNCDKCETYCSLPIDKLHYVKPEFGDEQEKIIKGWTVEKVKDNSMTEEIATG